MTRGDVAIERKDQIVRATVECITKYGYHNFSMQDVARTAGVSKGIIHYYFLNKDDLMKSVLDKVASDIERVLAADIKASSDATDKLKTFMTICFDVVRNTKEYYQVNMDFWTQINQKPDVRTIISQHYTKFRETCATVIEDGIQSGEFKALNALEQASIIIATIDGVSLQWLFDESAFDYDQLMKAAVKQVTDSLKR